VLLDVTLGAFQSLRSPILWQFCFPKKPSNLDANYCLEWFVHLKCVKRIILSFPFLVGHFLFKNPPKLLKQEKSHLHEQKPRLFAVRFISFHSSPSWSIWIPDKRPRMDSRQASKYSAQTKSAKISRARNILEKKYQKM